MHLSNSRLLVPVATLLMVVIGIISASPAGAATVDPKLATDKGLRCHAREGFSREGPDGGRTVMGDRRLVSDCRPEAARCRHRTFAADRSRSLADRA